MTPTEAQEALDSFADIMVEGAEREWSKKNPKSVRPSPPLYLDMKAGLSALEEAGILVLPDIEVELEEDEPTVVPFTGRRKGPTPFDLEGFANFFRRAADDAEEAKIVAVGFVLIYPDHLFVTDWGLLPGTRSQDLLAAIDVLHDEVRDEVKASTCPDPQSS